MELKTAIEILEYHQEWRLGKREDMIHEPKKLTEALDVVLLELKKEKWVELKSEDDLPKEKDIYWVIDKSGNIEKVTYHGKDDLSIRIWQTQFTHYKPIIKPNAPTI